MAAPAAEPDWEASKENFQPLKTGRKAAALRDSTAELRTQAIEGRRRAFWEELAAYSGSDPLEVWLRFIRWTQDTFSAGGHKAELLPLLERCTAALQGEERYKQDIRYLRVWIQYADCLPDPGDVFSFLKEQGIGQEHALYYVAFATYLEARGGYAKADAAYQQGINRLAAPVDRLRAKLAEFQQRMARRIQRKAAEQGCQEAASPDHPGRPSLALLGGGTRRGGRAGGALGLKRKADAENLPAAGSGLDIFVDDEFSCGSGAAGGGAPAASAPAALFQPGRSAAAGAAWTKLAGFEAGRKENVQQAGVWAGQRLRQAGAHSAPAAPALEVFEDPELQEAGQAGSGGAAGEAGRPTLRQRLDRGGSVAAAGEEGIIQDPLHLHKAQAHVAPLPGFPGGAPEAPPAKRRREEAMAFDQGALLGSRGEELCFEEARAAAWLQRRAAEEQAAEAAAAAAEAEAGDDLPDMNLDLEGDTCALGVVLGASAGTPAAAQAAVPAEPPPQQQQQRASPLPAAQAGSPLVVPTVEVAEEACPAAFGSPVMVEAIAAPPSPAEAGAEVAGAEEAPAPAAEQAAGPAAAPSTAQEREEEAAVSPADSTDEAAEPASSAEQQQPGLRPTPFAQQAEPAACEPTVTLSSRDAFAAINQMFGGALPAATAPAGLLAGGGAAAGLEPTVTIATKDAFAALDAMFKGALPQDQPTLPLGRSGVLGGSGSGGIGHAPFGGSGGYEPTMTISTKAAFAALNNMFKGALPGEHASLPPTARGPVGGGYEPTVTISTMAAFEAVNSMFGGGTAAAAAPLQQPAAARRQQGGFRAPAPRPRPAADSLPADSPAGGGGGGFSINEDTQFVSVPLGCDDGDDGGAAGSPGAVVVGGGGMGSFCVHEDTQFITVSAAGADEEEEEDAEPARQASPAVSGGGLGGLMIREDTQYITVAVPQRYDECTGDDDALAGEAIAAVEGGEWAPAGTPDPSQGFRIREDTRHAGPPAAAAAGGSFCIREDTMFLGLGATPATSPGSSLGGTAGCPSGGPGSSPRAARKRPLSELRDGGSTGDLLGGGGDASPLLAAGSPAHSANDGQVGKWGFAPGADDTLALQLDLGDTQALLEAVGQAAAADPTAAAQLQAAADGADGGAAPGASPALEAHLEGLQLADSKENLPVEAAAVAAAPGATARSLSDPVAAAAALRPLGEARAAALGGVEVEWNVEAEAAVVAAGLPEQDSFMVWVDDGEEGSPPLMGSPAGSGGSQTCAAPAAAGAAAAQPGAAAKKLEQAGTAHLLSPAGEVVAGAGFVTPVRQWPEGGAGEVPALDPFSPSFRGRMLACLEPAVAEWPGVHCMSEGEEAEAEVGLEAAARGTSGLVELQLCGLEFAVSGCIGEGAYARVFQGVDGDCGDVALKLEGPPCPWEWYVCKALAARVPPAARRHFVDPSALLLGAKASVLVAPLGPHGSLQDLVNAYLARQQAPPEALAMHFAVQLLRIMREMHAAHVVHTDIKPDNLLVTVESGEGPGGNEAPGPALGLQLIDFGRALDLDLLPAGALLQGDSGTDSFRCVEMREGRPWVWQADAYGVAATVHCLLYGRYMEVERVQEQATGAVSLRLCEPFKRHWAAELWGPFFSLLLNHTDVDTPPSVEGLISAFEARLSGSREAARQLRQEMSRAAALLPQRC